MRRYWIDAGQLQTQSDGLQTVIFESEQFHHIFDVCRQQLGSRFEVIHPNRNAYLVEVIELKKKMARAQVLETRVIAALPLPELHLALSVPRFPVFESVLEKMVEMGVCGVHPFFSELSFIRDPKSFASEKMTRWKKIVTSATQQSGRGELMQIESPKTWAQTLQEINQDADSLCLFCYEGQSTLGVKDFLASQLEKKITPKKVWLVIGSEGGFSQNEVQQMQSQGFHPVTLGSQVLRVETACMTLVSVLKYEFDLMR